MSKATQEVEARLLAEAQMLAEARADVVQADQKASILLAALGVGFAAVIGGQMNGSFVPTKFTPIGGFLWWAGVVVAALAVACAGLSVWPRFKSDDSSQFGITYWGHVAAFDRLADLEAALNKQDGLSLKRTRHQLWRLSKLVRTKYRFVRAALSLGAVAAVLLVVGGLIIR